MLSSTCTPTIRWMLRRDLPSVLAIESVSFAEPWLEEEFIKTLRQRNIIGMVAESGDLLSGYVIYSLHQRHLQIENIAVAPESRRSGVGRIMVERLISKLSIDRRWRIRALVRESNLDAQLFFKKCGFRCTGIIEGAYEGISEPAYAMEYRL